MSEHTSATWLMPPSSNSVLVLSGLIIVWLPSVPGQRPGQDADLNLTSASVLAQEVRRMSTSAAAGGVAGGLPGRGGPPAGAGRGACPARRGGRRPRRGP